MTRHQPGWQLARDYQKEDAQILSDGPKVGLWNATGLGKTLTALLAWSLDEQFPVLIVTRAIGRHVWGRDGEWGLGPDYRFGTVVGREKRWDDKRKRKGRMVYSDVRQCAMENQFTVLNYEILKYRIDDLIRIPWRYVIFDEAHYLKQGYMRPKRLKSGGIKVRRYEAAFQIANSVHKRHGRVWELTATPIRDRLRDLYGQLRVALPHETKSAWNWLHRYCDAKPGEFGGIDTTGQSNVKELRDYIRTRFIRRTRASVADQMPSVQRDVRMVEGVGTWRYLGGGIENAIARAAEIKLPYAAELSVGYLNERMKVVIVTNRVRITSRIVQYIQKECKKDLAASIRRDFWLRSVTGTTPINQRQDICGEFQSTSKPACLVASMDSVLESIDLHQADGLIFCAIPWTPYQITQMEGRVGRLGGKSCIVHYLIAERTVDERLKTRLLDKMDVVESAGVDTLGGAAIGSDLDGLNEEKVLADIREWLKNGSRRAK